MTTVHVSKLQTLTGHKDCVYALQPSGDPDLFFSGGGDGMVVLWDLKNPGAGKLIARLPNSIYALHYLKDRDILVAGHNYDGIHLLDWRNKKELKSLQLTTAAIFDIQSHGNDLFVATGGGTVIVVDIDQWVIRTSFRASEKSARTMAVNPNQGEIAVGYSDHMIRVFDLTTFGIKREWVAHQNSVFTLAYDPAFEILLSGSRDARLKSWKVAEDYRLSEEVVAHLYAINNIEFSGDGKHFVTCSLDKAVKVWEFGKLKLLKVIDKARHTGHGTSVNKLLWLSSDVVVSASDDRTLSVWNIIFFREHDQHLNAE